MKKKFSLTLRADEEKESSMEYIKVLREKTGNMPLILNGAAGAILKENRILMVFHKGKKMWQIPGGLQEYGERLEETVEREIKEELGLDLIARDLVGLLSDKKYGWKYNNGFEIHPVTAFYIMVGKYKEKDIILQKEEIEKYQFFDLNEIPKNTFSCCKEKVRLLKNVYEEKRKS